MAQTVKVVTRSTAPTTTKTNPEYGESDTSTNKGAALTSSEMDMNLLNLKDAIEGTSTRFDEAHNENGSLKALSVDGGDLSANSVDYSKIKSVHYGVDGGSVANAMTFAATGLAALEDGMLFLVKVSNANTGAATLEVTGSSGSLGAKSVYKNKNTPLISGDLKAGEMVGMLYDLSNTAFQLLGGGVEDSIALSALATQTTGSLISFGANGIASVVPPGTTGQVLTATTSSAPAFATQGGNIEYIDSDEDSSVLTSTTPAQVMATVSITAAQISKYSKLLITAEILGSSVTSTSTNARSYSLFQGSSLKATRNYKRNQGNAVDVADSCDLASFSYLETSPGTSASTFEIRDNGGVTGHKVRCFNLRIYGIG